MKPFITVCLPTFNRAKYLSTALESIRNQTHKNFELIICNDGSTDDTKKIISTFHAPCSILHVITHKKNSGYTQSILECARKAKGDWVLFMSDDDVMEPEMLATYVRVVQDYKNEKPAIITSQVSHIDRTGRTIFIPKHQIKGEQSILCKPKEFIYNYTLHGKKISNLYDFNTAFPSTLFKKDIFLKYYDESDKLPVAHDLLISSKICLLYPVVVIDKTLLRYRIHDNWGSQLSVKGDFLKEYLSYLQLLDIFVKQKKIKFNYNFFDYCHGAFIRYLISPTGGIVKMAMRYQGSYKKRTKEVLRYSKYCIEYKPLIILYPYSYITIILSILPQSFLLYLAQLMKKI